MGLGLGYTWVFDETSKFTLALDVNKLLVPLHLYQLTLKIP